jgi:hypothetical protein
MTTTSSSTVSDLPNTLIWTPIRHVVESIDPKFKEFLRKPSIRSFPDGTAYLEGDTDVLMMHNLLLPHKQARRLRIRENTQFRSISVFPKTKYCLLITGEYFEQIGGEQDLIACPTSLGEPQLGENHPEHLLVRVRFWGGLPKEARSPFYKAMIAWADSVGTQGIFGEGPAYLFPDSFLFNRRWASFSIDVSGAGQNTLNWLTLSILNFAAKGDYVSWIRYGDPKDAEE